MKTLAAICALLISTLTVAQSIKYDADLTAYKFKQDGIWGGWTNWVEDNSSIVFNKRREDITIKSDEGSKLYLIDEIIDPEMDDEGDIVYAFICIDSNGIYMEVRIVLFTSMEDQLQLYLIYEDKKTVYNIYRK